MLPMPRAEPDLISKIPLPLLSHLPLLDYGRSGAGVRSHLPSRANGVCATKLNRSFALDSRAVCAFEHVQQRK
jgi:hypothetical protein